MANWMTDTSWCRQNLMTLARGVLPDWPGFRVGPLGVAAEAGRVWLRVRNAATFLWDRERWSLGAGPAWHAPNRVRHTPASPAGPCDAARRDTLVADGLVSIEEAMGFLSVSRSTLYELMDQGLLPYAKIGRSRRIPKRALVELAATNLRGGNALDVFVPGRDIHPTGS